MNTNTQRLYMNVYRAGHYHRQGKPGHTNIHGGDFFTTEKDALECAERHAGYIATVGFDMPIPDGVTILANPDGSEPTPLHITRGNPLTLMPWHTAPVVFPVAILDSRVCPLHDAPAGGWDSWGSLDTSEGEAHEPYTPSYAGHAMAGPARRDWDRPGYATQ